MGFASPRRVCLRSKNSRNIGPASHSRRAADADAACARFKTLRPENDRMKTYVNQAVDSFGDGDWGASYGHKRGTRFSG